MKRYQIIVKGSNIQRCGFRKVAAELAIGMGISGVAVYVGNYIHIDAEGKEEKIKQFTDWCKTGPKYCDVSDIELVEYPVKGFSGFEILYGVHQTKSD